VSILKHSGSDKLQTYFQADEENYITRSFIICTFTKHFRTINLRRNRLVGHAARIIVLTKGYETSAQKYAETRPFGRARRRKARRYRSADRI
jgi:hypothetical protein